MDAVKRGLFHTGSVQPEAFPPAGAGSYFPLLFSSTWSKSPRCLFSPPQQPGQSLGSQLGWESAWKVPTLHPSIKTEPEGYLENKTNLPKPGLVSLIPSYAELSPDTPHTPQQCCHPAAGPGPGRTGIMLDHSCIKLLLVQQGAPSAGEAVMGSVRCLGAETCRPRATRRLPFPYLGHSPLETFSARSNGMYC